MKIPLGKVTPIYKGAYAAAAEYLVNDIVLHTDGNLYWHVSDTPTTGVAPTDGTVWAVAFSGADAKAAIEGFVTAAEGWANGTHDGDPVGSSDPAYHNNAAWWNEKAAKQADAAAGAKTGAESARDTAAQWATGGTSGTPSAANNAKKYAEDAAAAQTAAESARDAAAQWATGGTSGTPGASNNAKYYSEQAAASAAAAAANSGLAPAFDSTATYAVGDLVLYDGAVYRFTTAHTGAWDAADVEQTTLGEEVTDLDAAKADKTDVATADAALEQMILASFPTDTITNVAVASFTDGADNIPVKALTVNITPVQSSSGDPSPTNVRPISGWTGAEITKTGDNLLDRFCEKESGYYDDNGDYHESTESFYTNPFIPVKANTSYVFLLPYFSLVSRFYFYDETKAFISRTPGTSNGIFPYFKSITTPINCAYVRFQGREQGSWDSPDPYFNSMMFSEGSVAPTYEDFGGYIQFSWQSEAGTVYGGKLTDNGDGTWTLQVTHEMFDAAYLTWNAQSANTTTWLHSTTDFMTNGVDYAEKYVQWTGAIKDIPLNNFHVSSTSGVYVNTGDNTDASNKPTGKFVLKYKSSALPDPITLTADSVKTFLGTNNIWADCGDTTVDYRADPTLFINDKIAALTALISET